VIHALLILALAQGGTITRLDPNKGAYQESVDALAEAEKLLEKSPEMAVEKLSPVFGHIERGHITKFEQLIVMETKAQETQKYEFYPYQLRGRARLLAAQKRKDDEARRFLVDAVADLRISVRKTDLSKSPLATAHQELWDNVRAALTYEGWKAGGTQLAQSMALIADTEHAPKASEWLGAEIGRVDAQVRELRKTTDLEARRAPAGQAANWCDILAASLKDLTPFKAPLAAIALTRALAVSIRDSKGTFRLKIIVSPWAKVEHLKRQDEEIGLNDRDTPLVIPQELEIDSYTVELFHPSKGRKKVPIDANPLQPGRTYVLWGDMAEGKFQVTELLK